MASTTEFSEEVVEQRIDDTLARAKAVVDKILGSNAALIKEIKNSMAKGVDVITTAQLQEWMMAIPIIIQDIVNHKEAYALVRDMWNIETKQMGAKNLLELDMKKTEIHSLNQVSGTGHKKKEVIAGYVHSILAGVQESLWVMSNAIRKIIDVRIASGFTV